MAEYTGKTENGFKVLSKRIQGQHIESKMHHIGMDETVRDETVILPAPADGRWVKNQIIHQFLLAECADGNDAGNDDNDEGYAKLHALGLIFKSKCTVLKMEIYL